MISRTRMLKGLMASRPSPQIGLMRSTPLILPMKRFNSTSAQTSTTASDIKTTLTNFDTEQVSNNADQIATTLTSDQAGYLHSIGLADGWGPTAIIERILEITHVYTGLPWWATIAVATVGIRAAMVPLYVKASANAAKMSHVKPELDKALSDLQHAGNQQEQLQAAANRKKIMKENDIKMSHQFFPMIQLPIAYGFFQALRKMANYPVEGFQTQGLAWFEDLSAVDPYCGLQILTAAVVVGMVRSGGETGATQINPLMKKLLLWLPIVSIFITKEFSAAVVVYFAINSTFSFFQTLLLRSQWFRTFMQMPEMAKPNPDAPKGPSTVSEWWSDFNEKNQQKLEKKKQAANSKADAMQKRKISSTPQNFIKRH